MLSVSDIMSRNVLTLDVGASVCQAAEALSERRVSGAPVTEENRVVGVLSTTNLARAKDLDASIRAFMGPLVHFVRPEDPAQRVADLLLNERMHRVVVVDVDGAAVGIVTAADVLRASKRQAIRSSYPSVWPPAHDSREMRNDDDDF